MSNYKCPKCGSFNTHEITGLIIGHQIEGICNNCSYKWVIKPGETGREDNEPEDDNKSGFIDPADKPGIDD